MSSKYFYFYLVFVVLVRCTSTHSKFQNIATKSCPLPKTDGIFVDATDSNRKQAEKIALIQFVDEFQYPLEFDVIAKVKLKDFCEERDNKYTATVGISEDQINASLDVLNDQIKDLDVHQSEFDSLKQVAKIYRKVVLWEKAKVYFEKFDLDVRELDFQSVKSVFKESVKNISFSFKVEKSVPDHVKQIFKAAILENGVKLTLDNQETPNYEFVLATRIEEIPMVTQFQFVRLFTTLTIKDAKGNELATASWDNKGGGLNTVQASYRAAKELEKELSESFVNKVFGGD